MISTGITGTARHGTKPNSASMHAGEHVGALGAAAGEDRLAGAAHVIGVDGVADHLQREIGFHGRADVEIAVAEQRPAAMRALDAAQIDGDLGFERGIDRLAEIVPQQHVFGRDGGVGLELEQPMAVGALARQQRVRRRFDVPVEIRVRRSIVVASLISVLGRDGAMTRSAARLPERIAPSMVAGKPVFVQSPASTRLRHAVAAPGRLASCAGVAAKVARRSRTICHGGSAAGKPVTLATSLQIVFASSSRGISISRSPALMVTDSRPGKAKIHCDGAVEHAEDRRLRRPAARCGNAH